METFLGPMFADKSSLLTLQPDWQPAGNPNFALKDFVKFALGLQRSSRAEPFDASC
ncbi:MAG TPA: hypothetical protein VKP58_16625 [Candidatus Acidoferrum sp.]|nr:hypothetical protein [Candidatus Acidoferrum sp.]